MPLNIKDPVAKKLARALAAAAGESVTTAVRRAAEERLQRVRRQQSGRSLAARKSLRSAGVARPCRISMHARRTRFSAMTDTDYRADGYR